MRINQLTLPPNAKFAGEVVVFVEPSMSQMRHTVEFETDANGEIRNPSTSNTLPNEHMAHVGDVIRLTNIVTQEVILLGAHHNGKSSYPKYDAIHTCALSGLPDLAAELLASGYDPDFRHPENNGSALHFCAGVGSTSVARVLVENGADLEALDHSDLRPLEVAMLEENWDIAEILIGIGADLNCRIEGTSLMAWAQRFKATGVLNALRQRGEPQS